MSRFLRAFRRVFRVCVLGTVAAILVQAPLTAGTQADLLGHLVGNDHFNTLKISPDGEYVAATVPLERTTSLAIFRRSDMQMTGGINLYDNNHVIDFWWVSDNQVVVSIGQRSGRLESPRLTGEIMSVDANGGRSRTLAGVRAGTGQVLGSRIGRTRQEWIAAFMVDPLPNDPRHAIVSIQNLQHGEDQLTSVERIDTTSGRRTVIARAPVPRAEFLTDLAGEVRFAWGGNEAGRSQTYYRAGAGDDWQLINSQAASRNYLEPVGFSADNAIAYLIRSEDSGPDSLYAMDTATREMTRVLRGEFADPRPLTDPATGAVIGALFEEGIPRLAFLDEGSPAARMYRSLQASFEGSLVTLPSYTRDGGKALLRVSSDRSPVDYYVFDAATLSAGFLTARQRGVDPATMAERRPITLKSRDGLLLHGYLTLPNGVPAHDLPMVVNPHGGPFGPYDRWEFDTEAQLLAAHGYAVLQINFRGSGNYGGPFQGAGYREWGGKMQDDVTDATRWVIEQGIADASRICIYGGSYGAYAALMGAAREPDLYRCAAGNVGVYDLPLMHQQGDIPQSGYGRSYLERVLGSEGLEGISPNRLADRITAPVFLAAGGEDERAPLEHTRRMEAALKQSGSPVQMHVYRNEGHGYFLEANRRDFYERLLAFLGEHLAEGG